MASIIELHLVTESGETVVRTFERSFTIGRGNECGLQIVSKMVSRVHAAVSLEEGRWWISDLGSTNGTLVEDVPVQRSALLEGTRIRIGNGGPAILVARLGSVASTAEPRKTGEADGEAGGEADGGAARVRPAGGSDSLVGAPTPPQTRAAAGSHGNALSGAGGAPSVTGLMQRYFGEEEPSDDDSGSPHTRLIRKAYHRAKKRDRRTLVWTSGALVVALLFAFLTLGLQRRRIADLEQRAEEIFSLLREGDVQVAQFRRLLEQTENADFEAQLARLEQRQDELLDRYEGYVEQLGIYRKLRDPEERLIYRTARSFGESEFTIDADFVRATRETIHDYWLGPARSRLLQALGRGESSGLTANITRVLEEHGLPLEFFYLAVQESDLLPDRVGPSTRYGRAKGLWQFIPTTARRYGLDPGPFANAPTAHPTDERLNPSLASPAAARYMLDLYAELAQASGLLVMASYNWGEHRVGPRLASLTPQEAFAEAFRDVPMTPEARNYWHFLTTYGDRMPDETKDYVLKIFAAAVIGSDPRAFGLELDDPLDTYRDPGATADGP